MARPKFVNVDRDTPLLLPPDLREWIQDDDLAHFILEVLRGTDLTTAKVNPRGTGSAQYPPEMMLAVLIYCYATGVFGSRQIEALTYRHVSVRYLAGNHHPDHDTICAFRRTQSALLKAAFTQVLVLAAEMGLARVGRVCVDGTKILAAAAKRRTFNENALVLRELHLQEEINALVQQAEQADAQPAPAAPEAALPKELASRQARLAQLQAARQRLHEQTIARAQARRADQAAWAQDPCGERPETLRQLPDESDRINLTDPESGLMKLAQADGFQQGYNAQLAVSAERVAIILATGVSAQTHDRHQLLPMAQAAVAHSPVPVTTVVGDTGYDHARQATRAEATLQLEVLCPPQAPPAQAGQSRTKISRTKSAAHQRSAELRTRQRVRAESDEGRQWLRERRTTVEPAFGWIKATLGFRRFHLRGLARVSLEWELVALAYNCRRLCHRHVRQIDLKA